MDEVYIVGEVYYKKEDVVAAVKGLKLRLKKEGYIPDYDIKPIIKLIDKAFKSP